MSFANVDDLPLDIKLTSLRAAIALVSEKPPLFPSIECAGKARVHKGIRRKERKKEMDLAGLS